MVLKVSLHPVLKHRHLVLISNPMPQLFHLINGDNIIDLPHMIILNHV